VTAPNPRIAILTRAQQRRQRRAVHAAAKILEHGYRGGFTLPDLAELRAIVDAMVDRATLQA
jgi:hypothetical protein